MKQTLARVRLFVVAASLAVFLSGVVAPMFLSNVAFVAVPRAWADHCGDLPHEHPACSGKVAPPREDSQEGGDPALDCLPGSKDANDCNLYKKYINPIIWFLSALVGLAVTIGLIMGGIRYSTSGGDPSQAAAAKKQIRNAIVALLAYLFLLAALNWLVPGGLR